MSSHTTRTRTTTTGTAILTPTMDDGTALVNAKTFRNDATFGRALNRIVGSDIFGGDAIFDTDSVFASTVDISKADAAAAAKKLLAAGFVVELAEARLPGLFVLSVNANRV